MDHRYLGRNVAQLVMGLDEQIDQQRIDLRAVAIDLVILRAMPLRRVLKTIERALAGQRLAVHRSTGFNLPARIGNAHQASRRPDGATQAVEAIACRQNVRNVRVVVRLRSRLHDDDVSGDISDSRPGRDRQPAASVQSWGPPDFFRKRQKSGRLMAARSNYLRLRSHLRAAVAMIDMKSSGLGGGKGDMCQDRDLLLGKSGPAFILTGHRGGRPVGPRFLETKSELGRTIVLSRSIAIASTCLGVALSVVLAPQSASAQIIYACKNNSTGDLRVVAQGARCPRNWSHLDWNVAGPPGPQGMAGPPGQPARKVLPDQWDPKVRLDCKDRPAPKACVERLARSDNLERPAHLECPARRASVAR
jgi:hypothetical protein